MPEIRQNMVTKEWVIIATERAKRPEAFVQAQREHAESRPVYVAGCPFCPGHEELDLETLRIPTEGPWTLRAVRNRYPALSLDGEPARQFDGLHRSLSGVGHHEVIVESRCHNVSPASETRTEVETTLRAFQIRGREFQADERIAQIICFKNHGPTAGASLHHPHAQMLALPMVPYSVRGRIEDMQRYSDDHGTCALCDMLAAEEAEATRIVFANQSFVAFVPYAALSPFHVWIVPRHHRAHFFDAHEREFAPLAEALQTVLQKIYHGLNDPDYNYAIRTAPVRTGGGEHLHWYMSVVPRVSHMAGFELGSGMYINTALPEESARFLREYTIPTP